MHLGSWGQAGTWMLGNRLHRCRPLIVDQEFADVHVNDPVHQVEAEKANGKDHARVLVNVGRAHSEQSVLRSQIVILRYGRWGCDAGVFAVRCTAYARPGSILARCDIGGRVPVVRRRSAIVSVTIASDWHEHIQVVVEVDQAQGHFVLVVVRNGSTFD